MPNLGGGELLIIFAIILLIFGGAKLPKLARSLGEARKEFEKGTAEADREQRSLAAKDTTDDPAADLARREAELARREAELQRREANDQ